LVLFVRIITTITKIKQLELKFVLRSPWIQNVKWVCYGLLVVDIAFFPFYKPVLQSLLWRLQPRIVRLKVFQSAAKGTEMDVMTSCDCQFVVEEITSLAWTALSQEDLMVVAWGYYYFSVQFRESLNLACEIYPEDPQLQLLREGECDTDNLSPYPGIAGAGERINHDEFMRRVLSLTDIGTRQSTRLRQLGMQYLALTRDLPSHARAMSIPTYEDGGLESVFRSILTAPDWDHPSLKAFRHFLIEHIRFDSDSDAGHGALSRHLQPDSETILLWTAFRDLLIDAAPCLMPISQELCA